MLEGLKTPAKKPGPLTTSATPGGAEILKPDKSAEEAHRHHIWGPGSMANMEELSDRDNCHNWLAAAHICFRNFSPRKLGEDATPFDKPNFFQRGLVETRKHQPDNDSSPIDFYVSFIWCFPSVSHGFCASNWRLKTESKTLLISFKSHMAIPRSIKKSREFLGDVFVLP